MWKIVHNGTANVGMRLSGSDPSDTRVAPSATSPMELLLLNGHDLVVDGGISGNFLGRLTRISQITRG